jgi:hypothetical protein
MTREDVCYFPLSLSQEGMWLTLQMTPATPAYNVPYVPGLKGTVHKEFLARALAESIACHETLRTTFALQDDMPVQVVSETLPLPYEEHDFRDTPDPEAAAGQCVSAESQRLFDLAGGPLIRVKLLQTGDEQYQLLFVLHHMICDGWSMEILLREIAELYTSCCQARAHRLAPLPIQYADFAVWERQQVQEAGHQKRIAYWREALAGAPALLAGVSEYPHPPQHTLQGAEHHLELPRELADQLAVSGQSEQCTLFMTLLAAFQAMLYGWTRQSDIVIGSPLANRTRPEVQGLIGLFSNMLSLRSQLPPDLTWKQLLRQTRSRVLAAHDHQDLPFEGLVRAVQPAHTAGASPCFQVTFSIQQYEREALSLPGIAVRAREVHNGTSKFDLTLHIHWTPDHWSRTLIYSTALFTAQTIQQMADYLHSVLHYLATHPEGVIIEVWQQVLGFSEIEREDNFFDLGGYSLLMIQVQRQLQEILQVQISLTDLLRFPTVHGMALFLSQGVDTESALVRRRERGRARDEALQLAVRPIRLTTEAAMSEPFSAGSDIAIIGMAGHFPGAPDIDTFWEQIRDGVESIYDLSDAYMLACGVRPASLQGPAYVKRYAVLEDRDLFAASFSGYTPMRRQSLILSNGFFWNVPAMPWKMPATMRSEAAGLSVCLRAQV